jgi:hypothetical protein
VLFRGPNGVRSANACFGVVADLRRPVAGGVVVAVAVIADIRRSAARYGRYNRGRDSYYLKLNIRSSPQKNGEDVVTPLPSERVSKDLDPLSGIENDFPLGQLRRETQLRFVICHWDIPR